MLTRYIIITRRIFLDVTYIIFNNVKIIEIIEIME